MVSAKTLAAAVLGGLPSTMALISSITAASPSVPAGTLFGVNIETGSYPENYLDFAIIWGISPASEACDDCIGAQVGYTPLYGPDAVTEPPSGNFSLAVLAPNGYSGDYTLHAAVPFLVGASGDVAVNYLNTSIHIIGS